MDLAGAHPMFTTADAGAVYRVLPGRPARRCGTSKVLDAQFPSRFGQLSWRAGQARVPDPLWQHREAGHRLERVVLALADPAPSAALPRAFCRSARAYRHATNRCCTRCRPTTASEPGRDRKEISVKPAPARTAKTGELALQARVGRSTIRTAIGCATGRVVRRAPGPTGPSEEAAFYYWSDERPGYVSWLEHASLPKLNYNAPALAARMVQGPDSVIGRWLPSRTRWTAGGSTSPT